MSQVRVFGEWVFFLQIAHAGFFSFFLGGPEDPITKRIFILNVGWRAVPVGLAGDRRRWRVPGESSNRTCVGQSCYAPHRLLRAFVTGAPNYPPFVTFERHTLRLPDSLLTTSLDRTGVEDASVHCASHMPRATPKAQEMQARMSRSASRSSLAFWLTRCKPR